MNIPEHEGIYTWVDCLNFYEMVDREGYVKATLCPFYAGAPCELVRYKHYCKWGYA